MVTLQRRNSDFENGFHQRKRDSCDNSENDNNEDGSSKAQIAMTIQFRKVLEERDGQKILLGNEELCRFLRAGAFDIPRARVIFEKNEKYNRENADLVAITFGMVEHVYATQVVQVLRERDQGGCKIIIVNARNWNPDETSLEFQMLAAWYMFNEMLYSVETQVKGVSVILDLSGVSMRMAARFVSFFTLKQIHRLLSFYEGGYPVKLKSLHGVNTPLIVSSTYAGFKYLLKKKIRDRIHVHYCGPKVLDKYYSKDILPISLDGSLPNNEAIDSELMQRMYRRHNPT